MHTRFATATRPPAAAKTRSPLFYGAAWLILTGLSTWALVAAGVAS